MADSDELSYETIYSPIEHSRESIQNTPLEPKQSWIRWFCCHYFCCLTRTV
jgi:hypothetical protein